MTSLGLTLLVCKADLPQMNLLAEPVSKNASEVHGTGWAPSLCRWHLGSWEQARYAIEGAPRNQTSPTEHSFPCSFLRV